MDRRLAVFLLALIFAVGFALIIGLVLVEIHAHPK